MTGAIRTKSIGAPREAGDGVRILVARFYPRGAKREHFDRWMRDLAPSAGLLRSYRGGGLDWGRFCTAYRREMRGAELQIRQLHSESRRATVTLLCYEPDGERCHRHLLREMVSDPSLLRADFEAAYEDR